MSCLPLATIAVALTAAAAPGPGPAVESAFVTTPDKVRIHVLEAGRPGAPAILFVPGWTMAARIWQAQIDYFAATYRVVAMDPRGQGDSDKPHEGLFPAARARDIKAVVDALGLAPVVLVGWSMGVTEVGSYIDQFGTGSVRAVVLVDGIFGADWDPVGSPAMIRWAASFQADRRGATERFSRFMCRKLIAEAALRQMADDALKTPTDTALALFVATMATDVRSVMAKIDRPTLLCVAPSVYMPRYKEMAQAIPGARLEVFEDAGHALFLDDGPRFNALLDAFLATAGPAAPAPPGR